MLQERKNGKNDMDGFSYYKNIANFEPFHLNILLSANLLFMKSNVGKIKTGEGGGGNGRNNGCVF